MWQSAQISLVVKRHFSMTFRAKCDQMALFILVCITLQLATHKGKLQSFAAFDTQNLFI